MRVNDTTLGERSVLPAEARVVKAGSKDGERKKAGLEMKSIYKQEELRESKDSGRSSGQILKVST